jgi:hypothetical protein
MQSNIGAGSLIASFAASAAGALVAGYSGVLWALRRRRAERAFDRRIEWTEEMHAALHAAAHAFDRLWNISGFPDAPQLEVDQADREADTAYREVRRLAAARKLYAPPRTAVRLDRALDEINTILVRAVATRYSESSETRSDRHLLLAAWMRDAADVLTDDVHVYLGYVPLWRRVWSRVLPRRRSGLVTSKEVAEMQVRRGGTSQAPSAPDCDKAPLRGPPTEPPTRV